MDITIFNIFISSIAFTMAALAYAWLSVKPKNASYGVRYLFLIFAIVKFTEIGNFIFIENSFQEILGWSYYEISQIIGNILMTVYPIANANIVLSTLSTSPEKLKKEKRFYYCYL